MRRGDVALLALPGDDGKPRPALVVQADALTADDGGGVVVCPLTTRLGGAASFRVAVAPTWGNGLHLRSEIMVEKLAGIAGARLRKVIGQLDRAAMTAADHEPLSCWCIGLAWVTRQGRDRAAGRYPKISTILSSR